MDAGAAHHMVHVARLLADSGDFAITVYTCHAARGVFQTFGVESLPFEAVPRARRARASARDLSCNPRGRHWSGHQRLPRRLTSRITQSSMKLPFTQLQRCLPGQGTAALSRNLFVLAVDATACRKKTAKLAEVWITSVIWPSTTIAQGGARRLETLTNLAQEGTS